MLERLHAGETDGIVVIKVDRFARSVANGAAIVRRRPSRSLTRHTPA
jgi:DNA invertase Pin-like site-specific DNA recombinase